MKLIDYKKSYVLHYQQRVLVLNYDKSKYMCIEIDDRQEEIEYWQEEKQRKQICIKKGRRDIGEE